MISYVDIWIAVSNPKKYPSQNGGWSAIILLPRDYLSAKKEKIEISDNGGISTSNRLELISVEKSIKKAIEKGYNAINLHTSNLYIVNMCNIITNWSKVDFERAKKKYKNMDLIEKIYPLFINQENSINVIWESSKQNTALRERAKTIAFFET